MVIVAVIVGFLAFPAVLCVLGLRFFAAGRAVEAWIYRHDPESARDSRDLRHPFAPTGRRWDAARNAATNNPELASLLMLFDDRRRRFVRWIVITWIGWLALGIAAPFLAHS